MKVVQIGEEREIGFEITSSDGSNFAIDASFEYKGPDENVLDSGFAQVYGNKVFTLLKPIVSNRNPVVFTCVITPLDTQGKPDITKNKEKLIIKIPVFVP